MLLTWFENFSFQSFNVTYKWKCCNLWCTVKVIGTRLGKLSKSCSPKVRQWQTFFVLLGSKEMSFLLQLSCQKIKREGVLYMVLLILKRKSETLFSDYNHEGFTLLFRSNLFAGMVMVNSSVFRGPGPAPSFLFGPAPRGLWSWYLILAPAFAEPCPPQVWRSF